MVGLGNEFAHGGSPAVGPPQYAQLSHPPSQHCPPYAQPRGRLLRNDKLTFIQSSKASNASYRAFQWRDSLLKHCADVKKERMGVIVLMLALLNAIPDELAGGKVRLQTSCR